MKTDFCLKHPCVCHSCCATVPKSVMWVLRVVSSLFLEIMYCGDSLVHQNAPVKDWIKLLFPINKNTSGSENNFMVHITLCVLYNSQHLAKCVKSKQINSCLKPQCLFPVCDKII